MDTSGLVKIWVDEAHSDQVRAAVRGASHLGSSMVAHAELGATLARLERERLLTHEEREDIQSDFRARWVRMHRVGVGPRLARRGADLARTHALRGFDAIHLATALTLQERLGSLTFVCFDKGLMKAAMAEGFASL